MISLKADIIRRLRYKFGQVDLLVFKYTCIKHANSSGSIHYLALRWIYSVEICFFNLILCSWVQKLRLHPKAPCCHLSRQIYSITLDRFKYLVLISTVLLGYALKLEIWNSFFIFFYKIHNLHGRSIFPLIIINPLLK